MKIKEGNMKVTKAQIKEHLMKECLNCHKHLTEEELNKNIDRYATKVKVIFPGKFVALCDSCQKLRDEGKIAFFKGLGEDEDD